MGRSTAKLHLAVVSGRRRDRDRAAASSSKDAPLVLHGNGGAVARRGRSDRRGLDRPGGNGRQRRSTVIPPHRRRGASGREQHVEPRFELRGGEPGGGAAAARHLDRPGPVGVDGLERRRVVQEQLRRGLALEPGDRRAQAGRQHDRHDGQLGPEVLRQQQCVHGDRAPRGADRADERGGDRGRDRRAPGPAARRPRATASTRRRLHGDADRQRIRSTCCSRRTASRPATRTCPPT